MREDRESVQTLEGVQYSHMKGGVQYYEAIQGERSGPVPGQAPSEATESDATLAQQPLGGIIDKDVGVQDSDNANTKVDVPECIPTSGVRDPSTGNVCYKQIKYDMSDFLGSCVRLYKDLTNSHDVPLKLAHTPFIDETGDDYGLGAGLCEAASDGG
jgi:hypothetical protein